MSECKCGHPQHTGECGTITCFCGSGIIQLILFCPLGHRHVDKDAFATKTRRHHTHACQECGIVWRPAIEESVGVQFLPGFKDS